MKLGMEAASQRNITKSAHNFIKPTSEEYD